jgi:hypothetical protein
MTRRWNHELKMNEASIWIIGDWRHANFSAAVGSLNALARCDCFDDIAAALVGLRSAARSRGVMAILILQSRPGQFTPEDVEHLHTAAPLARLVTLAGLWCEGEMRSGCPWPGVVRIPWCSWEARLPRELELAGVARAATAPLPRTATETERIEGTMRDFVIRKHLNGTAAICTSNRTTLESIAEALTQLGVEARWWFIGAESQIEPVDVMIVDGWEQIPVSNPSEITPCVLLLHFPRPEDIDRAAASGIAAVLSQPLLLADLSATLEALLCHRPFTADGRTLTPAAGRK